MDNQQNQQQEENNNQQEEQPKFKWIVTEQQALYLQTVRNHLILERAYQVLSMTQETMFEAAQATGYDLGRIKMIDELLETAQIARLE